MIDLAMAYLDAGINVIPVKLDGTKSPAVSSWTQYQRRPATSNEVQQWFASRNGIGLINGVVSDGMETLDFDERADEVFPAWLDLLSPTIRGKLTVIETGGLGYHVPYRCEVVCGNEKIAKTLEGGTLVETRGEGGYIVGVGSPLEVHDSGCPYVQTAGIPLPYLPTMTTGERKQLWQAARTFDQRQAPSVVADYVKRAMPTVTADVDTSTPWGDFDSRADWADILGPVGWHTKDGIVWTRPGKTKGTSAKVVESNNGCEVLTVFSSSAGELSPSGSHQTIGKFQAFKLLYHAGNGSEAAKALITLGYGRTNQWQK